MAPNPPLKASALASSLLQAAGRQTAMRAAIEARAADLIARPRTASPSAPQPPVGPSPPPAGGGGA